MNNLEKIFLSIKSLNKEIYDKYINNENLNIGEYYLYQITSFAISIIHEDLFDNITNYQTLYLYRAIIENLAILKLINNDKIDKDFEVLKDSYNYLTECYIFEKYKNIDDNLFHFSKDKIRYKLIDEEGLFNIIKEKIPFILNDYDFKELIKKELSELYDYYELIYPYTININISQSIDKFNSTEFTFSLLKLSTILLTMIYTIANKVISIDEKYKYSLDYEKSFIFNHPINKRYISYIQIEKLLIEKIDKKYEILMNSLYSLNLDKAFGFSEVLESKFVSFLNLASYNYYGKNNINELIDEINYESEYIKMLYESSALLNHRNAYLINSNIDLENEYMKIVYFLDLVILQMLKKDNVEKNVIEKFNSIINEKYEFDLSNKLKK